MYVTHNIHTVTHMHVHKQYQESKDRQAKLAQRMARSKFDPDADEVVSAYLMPVEPPNAVAYTAVLMLTDRSQFIGAEV